MKIFFKSARLITTILLMSLLLTVIVFTGCSNGNSGDGDEASTAYALNLDFEDWAGGMTVEKGTANTGNDTLSTISGRNCIQVNADSENLYDSTGVEIQFSLVDSNGDPAFIDMSDENWMIKFKYYLPSGGVVPAYIQYALYENRNWGVIYSSYVDCSVTDTWTEVSLPVNNATVGYSGFDNNPEDWDFNLFRLQFGSNTEGETILIYLDDLQVYNSSGEEEEKPYNPYIEYSGLNGVAKNPIVSHIFTADPSAHVFNGRVYVYTSHDLDKQTGYNMKDYHAFSSDDMVNWQDHGVVLEADDISWVNSLYAPDCVYNPHDGKYYLFFPNSGSGIGVAVSDSPAGPFTDAIGGPLITGSTPGVEDVEWVFDPACFVDDDGEVYLYFGGGDVDTGDNARVIRLNSDMVSLKDSSATTISAPDFFEASFVVKQNGKYYFTYSTSYQDHSATIDYMISDNPMTGFTYQGTILPNPPQNNSDNNHQSIVEYNGQWYIFYHNRVLANRDNLTNYQRCITLDYLSFDSDDTIPQVTPTSGTVTQIKDVDAFSTIEAEMIADQRGIEVENFSGCVAVTEINDKEWIGYSQVDFGSGADTFYANVASGYSGGGKILVYIDGCDLFTNNGGTLIGTCNVNSTGSWESWTDISCSLEETSGVHDVYLRFSGTEEENLFNLNSFYFE